MKGMRAKRWTRKRLMPLKEMKIQKVHELHGDGWHCFYEGIGECVSRCGNRDDKIGRSIDTGLRINFIGSCQR
jgi:hypothetical protein